MAETKEAEVVMSDEKIVDAGSNTPSMDDIEYSPEGDDLLEDAEREYLSQLKRPEEAAPIEIGAETKEEGAAEPEKEPEKPVEAPAAEEAKAEVAEPEKPAEPEVTEEPVVDAHQKPYYEPQLVEYVPEHDVKELKADLARLEADWKDEKIDDDRYNEIKAEINRRLISEEINEKSVKNTNAAIFKSLENAWLADQTWFYKQSGNDTILDDPALKAAMFATVEALTPKFRGRSNLELLQAARAELGKKFAISGEKSAKPKKEDEKPPAGKKPVIPVTLGGLPTAKQELMGDEFSYLKALDPVAKEEAIEKMSTVQFERYLKGK